MLKIVSATGGDFNFNGLDFSAFDFSGTGSQTLKVQGFLPDHPSGWINIHLPTPTFSIRNTAIGPRKSHRYWPAKASLSLI